MIIISSVFMSSVDLSLEPIELFDSFMTLITIAIRIRRIEFGGEKIGWLISSSTQLLNWNYLIVMYIDFDLLLVALNFMCMLSF
jgi:hypothetical protein